METTTRKSKKAGQKAEVFDAERIRAAYIDFVLNAGNRPPSVFKFCSGLGITEDIFYSHFGSFEGLEKSIWREFIAKTTDRLKADEQFHTFSSREQILAFYFTLFEELKQSRSFVLVQLQNRNRLEIVPEFLKDFKREFESFISHTLEAGRAAGEIAKRPYLDQGYPKIFWMHFGFILFFWRDDNSAGFEQTDAAIEKSVNLAFDLIGKGAIDSVVDFAKFLYQTKVK